MLIAKKNVENYYPIVGVLERFNETLVVLERMMPFYFKGASKVDYMEVYGLENILNARMKKPKLSDETKQMLRRNMTYEIEFYDFCVQRLHKQFNQISNL